MEFSITNDHTWGIWLYHLEIGVDNPDERNDDTPQELRVHDFYAYLYDKLNMEPFQHLQHTRALKKTTLTSQLGNTWNNDHNENILNSH